MGLKSSKVSLSSETSQERIIELIESIGPAFQPFNSSICKYPEKLSRDFLSFYYLQIADGKTPDQMQKSLDHYLSIELGIENKIRRQILLSYLRLNVHFRLPQDDDYDYDTQFSIAEGRNLWYNEAEKRIEDEEIMKRNNSSTIFLTLQDLQREFIAAEEGYPQAMEILLYWQQNPPNTFFQDYIIAKRQGYLKDVNEGEIGLELASPKLEEEAGTEKEIADKLATAMFNLGWCYDYGIGGEEDKGIAITFYERSIELGSLKSLNQLGFCYHHGRGVEKDYKRAYEIYLEAAEKGHVMSMNQVGFFHSNGLFVPKNRREAWNWYEEAADSGNIASLCNLACALVNYPVEPEDNAKGLEKFHLAAELGCIDSAMTLAQFFYREEKYDEALRWSIPSAMRGGIGGMYYTALCYLKRYQSAEFKTLAFNWIWKAAMKGAPIALNKLAEMFEKGIGTAVNIQEAFRWYGLAAFHSNRDAMYTLSRFHAEGRATEKNNGESLKWALLAHDHKKNIAAFVIAANFYSGRLRKNDSKIIHWLKKGARKDKGKSIAAIDTIYRTKPKLYI